MANKVTFNIEGILGLEVSQMTNQLKTAQAALGNLQLPPGFDKKFQNLFKGLTDQLEDFESKSKRTFNTIGEVQSAEKSYSKLMSLFKDLSFEMGRLNNFKLEVNDKELVSGIENAKKAMQNFDTQTNSARQSFEKIRSQLKEKYQAKINVDNLIDAAQAGKGLGDNLKTLRQMTTVIKVDADQVKAAEVQVTEIQTELKRLGAERDTLERRQVGYSATMTTGNTESARSKAAQSLAASEVRIKAIDAATQRLNTNLGKAQEVLSKWEIKKENTAAIEGIVKGFEELEAAYKDIDLNTVLGPELSERFKDIIAEASSFQDLIQRIDARTFSEVAEQMDTATTSTAGFKVELDKAGDQVNEFVSQADNITSISNQMQSLQTNMLQFFSVTSGWRLFKDAVRSAYETVKELDAAMTEIAVVSDYNLDDIWSMREDFSAEATKMGATTLDLIDATKLYVQQGLDLVEAQKIGIETVKMARIANLDGAQATDLMTAAIRGYHMELSQANEVNDIYSELAAKSAADTQEIAIAMSKTASIAANAGAEFGNMSAFLTQIIETTREAKSFGAKLFKSVA